jgi:hypothetical protein
MKPLIRRVLARRSRGRKICVFARRSREPCCSFAIAVDYAGSGGKLDPLVNEALNLKAAVETRLNAERPGKIASCRGILFHPPDERHVARIPDRRSRESGNPWQQKTPVLHVFAMGPRLREDDAAEMLAGVGQTSTAGSRLKKTGAAGLSIAFVDAKERRKSGASCPKRCRAAILSANLPAVSRYPWIAQPLLRAERWQCGCIPDA